MTTPLHTKDIDQIVRRVETAMFEVFRPYVQQTVEEIATKRLTDLVDWHVKQRVGRPWRTLRVGAWTLEYRSYRQ